MSNFSILIYVLVGLMILSEIYKIFVEKTKELDDERGVIVLLKTKGLSYNILFVGIIVSIISVSKFSFLKQGDFIYLIMIILFLQSIVSTIYLLLLKKV